MELNRYCDKDYDQHQFFGVRSHPKLLFTPDEDQKLRDLVATYGTGNWSLIAKEMKTKRNCRQCRERWYKYLSPEINHQPWTKEEDELLEIKYAEYGPKWKAISMFFNNRTDINVKSRWLKKMREKAKSQRSSKLNTPKIKDHFENMKANQAASNSLFQNMFYLNPPSVLINSTNQQIPFNQLYYNNYQTPNFITSDTLFQRHQIQVPVFLQAGQEENDSHEISDQINDLDDFARINDIDWDDMLIELDNSDMFSA